jgi:primary-amine oxidase
MPSGFFNLNPSNDLPRETNKKSVLVGADGVECHC